MAPGSTLGFPESSLNYPVIIHHIPLYAALCVHPFSLSAPSLSTTPTLTYSISTSPFPYQRFIIIFSRLYKKYSYCMCYGAGLYLVIIHHFPLYAALCVHPFSLSAPPLSTTPTLTYSISTSPFPYQRFIIIFSQLYKKYSYCVMAPGSTGIPGIISYLVIIHHFPLYAALCVHPFSRFAPSCEGRSSECAFY